jgi:hypothetical protein
MSRRNLKRSWGSQNPWLSTSWSRSAWSATVDFLVHRLLGAEAGHRNVSDCQMCQAFTDRQVFKTGPVERKLTDRAFGPQAEVLWSNAHCPSRCRRSLSCTQTVECQGSREQLARTADRVGRSGWIRQGDGPAVGPMGTVRRQRVDRQVGRFQRQAVLAAGSANFCAVEPPGMALAQPDACCRDPWLAAVADVDPIRRPP